MVAGVVKKWFGDRGFGFVTPADGGEDVFVHMKVLQDGNDYLTEGEEVEFEAEWNDQKGKMTAVSCTGGYSGGPWAGGAGGKGGKGGSGGYGKAAGGGKGGFGYSPYGGKGKSRGKY